MISEKSIYDEYESARLLPGRVFFFQDETAKYTLNYWLKPSDRGDLIVVSKDELSDDFALTILKDSSSANLVGKPVVCGLSSNDSGFSNILIVPPSYHGYLKGNDAIDRSNLYFCIPIFRCEFSGSETEEEFRWLRLHNTPILDWNREAHPILSVYFDNPQTGGGSDKSGAFMKWSALIREIDLLDGIEDGFIEITNWAGQVVEIVSPESNFYILIEEREHETSLSKIELISQLKVFAYG